MYTYLDMRASSHVVGVSFFKRHCYLHRLSLCSPDSAVDLHTPLVSSCTCSSIAPFAAKGARVVGAVSGVPASLLRAFVSIHGAVRLWKRHLIMTPRITHEKSSQGGSTNVDMYHVIIASIYPTPHYFILPRNFKRCVRQRSGPRPHRTNGIRHYFRRECRSRQGGQLQRARRRRCQGVLSTQFDHTTLSPPPEVNFLLPFRPMASPKLFSLTFPPRLSPPFVWTPSLKSYDRLALHHPHLCSKA